MIKYTKDILVCKVGKKLETYNDEEINKIIEIGKKVSKEELINIIYRLSELESKMKQSSQRTIIFQTEIIKLCMKKEIQSAREVAQKPTTEARISERTKDIPKIQENAAIPKNTVTKKIEPVQSGDRINNWDSVLTDLKKQGKVILYANLVNTEAVQVNDMTVEIRFKSGLNSFRKELLTKSENMNVLTKEIAVLCKKPMQIKFVEAGSSNNNTYIQTKKEPVVKPQETKEEEQEDIMNELDIPINIIDE